MRRPCEKFIQRKRVAACAVDPDVLGRVRVGIADAKEVVGFIVAYRFEEETLYRDQWLVLDRAQDSPSSEAQLLTGVTDVRLRFLDEELQWHSQWPPLNRTEVMPKAMEIVLELDEWGEITRLFRTPGV